MFARFKKNKIFFISLIVFLFVVFLLSQGHVYDSSEVEYGVTFSPQQARDLSLDWRAVFKAMFDDLGVKRVRLSAYWDEVEKDFDEYNWEDMDWQIAEAGERQAEIILAVGGRLPRWPECHFPAWAEKLDDSTREQEILHYIKATVERYRNVNSIVAWQVENEPFLSHFGNCPELDKTFLDKEIALVRSLDSRPIVVTDSGELSVWVPAARRADIFGTTMYRDTYSKVLGRYVHYPIGPGFFQFKKRVASWFAHPEKWIIIELQAEPWGPEPFQNLSQAERDRTMNLEKFKEIIEFARQAGFQKMYLWGVEWWYWEREVKNNPALWEEAKRIFNL